MTRRSDHASPLLGDTREDSTNVLEEERAAPSRLGRLLDRGRLATRATHLSVSTGGGRWFSVGEGERSLGRCGAGRLTLGTPKTRSL